MVKYKDEKLTFKDTGEGLGSFMRKKSITLNLEEHRLKRQEIILLIEGCFYKIKWKSKIVEVVKYERAEDGIEFEERVIESSIE